ncbi:VanW family protein [Clostridium folliculivorans]|uniref:Exported protein n=1 Tax=Clostridium folliculivorans TaxID=2886038 RepID=A0A9W5Y5Y3_9CLOT|nr:VanW family protein [Clostridium folliculivorans]GKU27155.1 exported protein [Clostridium folliculivorans]GKU31772.1 exported protein [Clostridium folliculivorans]
MSNEVGKNKTLKMVVAGTVAVVVIGLSGAGVYAMTVKNQVAKWDNKIYQGVKVNNVDLSGKTKEEAVKLLEDSFSNTIKQKKLVVKALDQNFELDYSNLNPQFNVQEIAQKALEEGKNLSLFQKNDIIKNGTNKNLPLEFKYDDSKIKAFEQQIESKINKDPVDAKISISGGNINITDDQTGRKVNAEELDKLIKTNINGKIEQQTVVQAPIEEVKSKYPKSELAKIDGKISTFSTSFATSNEGRSANVTLASKFINAKLLMPGDTFSYNETVGERTTARGFGIGAIFKGDKVEDEVGGGICQVSTTLYRAAMRAGIKPTERHNHSMPASYSPVGLDATVYWGSLDYKFKNTYDFPVYIESYASNKTVYVNFYGSVSGMGGKTYELFADTLDKYEPTISQVQDSSLAEGQTQWEKKPVTGYKVKSYLITYQGGKEVSRENIATDTYQKVNGVMKVGTKKATPPPAAPPAATQTQTTPPAQATQTSATPGTNQ